jgi:hypothetical protein
MKQPYGEGLASHTDPESCVVSREAGREALTDSPLFRTASRRLGLRNSVAQEDAKTDPLPKKAEASLEYRALYSAFFTCKADLIGTGT